MSEYRVNQMKIHDLLQMLEHQYSSWIELIEASFIIYLNVVSCITCRIRCCDSWYELERSNQHGHKFTVRSMMISSVVRLEERTLIIWSISQHHTESVQPVIH